MKQIYACFPKGTFKALTFSFDDGKIMDRRLIELFRKYGMKGTFHLNSGYLGEQKHHRFPYVNASEVSTLYEGQEVASHSETHPTMTRTPMLKNMQEVLQDRICLERLTNQLVRGFSYPNGEYNEQVIETLRTCGIVYARTTKDTHQFSLPQDYLQWHPTCRQSDPMLMELGETFLQKTYDQRLMLYYVWGHSYEFELDTSWDRMETFLDKMHGHKDIWYASNIEIYTYLKGIEQLQYFGDLHAVYNPNAFSIWLLVDGTCVEVQGNETCLLTGNEVG